MTHTPASATTKAANAAAAPAAAQPPATAAPAVAQTPATAAPAVAQTPAAAAPAAAQTPVLEDIEQVADGWVKKYILHYRMPDGSERTYEVASRKDLAAFSQLMDANGKGEPASGADAVCIVATTPRDTVLMIREFRYPLNSWCVAFPAGLIDPGEGIEECVSRELSEETGYALVPGSTVQPLPQPGYSSTGLTDETVHIVFAQAERAGQAHTEPGELIEVFELPIADIPRFLQQNTLPIGTRAQLALEILAARRRPSA